MRRRIAGIAGAVLVAAGGLTGCENAAPPLTRSGFFLDTTVTLSLYHTRDTSILDACFRQIDNFEKIFSRTARGSDIWNINHAGGKPVTVSEDTASLIRTALAYAERTQGALDITIAPVVSLWDFKSDPPRVPEEAALREAAALVDWTRVSCEGTTVCLEDPAMALDLGAVAKGYIADRLAAALREKGVTAALINLGGNIYALGDKDGGDWKIGVRDPKDENALAAAPGVQNRSVVTSGIYERDFTRDGVLYHHILDPETGRPVENGLASVTILSDKSVDGDALSTACFVLGEKKGLALIESLPDTEALFIRRDGVRVGSSGFPG